MTIQMTFQKGSERMIVRIIGNNVLFIDPQNNIMAPIEGLNLNKQGVIKEHPDLKDDIEWKQKAIQRFTDKVKSFKTENERADWIIEEMKQMKYIGLYQQKEGWRPMKIR